MTDTKYDLPLVGGCQCGGIRYEITGQPGQLYACHCRECQKLTASAFSMSLMVRYADFRLTKGAPRVWSRPTDGGNVLRCMFCPDCGSRVWHETSGDDEVMTLKPGSLDTQVNFADAIHIWTSRKLPGFEIPAGAVQIPGEPE